MATKPEPLIVIVGQTASGKSALGLKLAQKFNGEIICADSRTVYKGMDIGTAKPSEDEQKLVRHHLLDIITPDQKFTAADFKNLARRSIKDIAARGKLPIMVGGTGLYVDALLYDFKFAPKDAARDPKNPRHLHKSEKAVYGEVRPNTLIAGIDTEREALVERITARVENMIKRGLRQEAELLADHYGWDAPGLNAIGYREWQTLAENPGISDTEIAAEIIRDTVQYAKRQKTWFKRNKSIQWSNDPSKIVEIATTFLYKSSWHSE
jgi:tRNA dimethylallyltransferase